jgi:hypothetical protein
MPTRGWACDLLLTLVSPPFRTPEVVARARQAVVELQITKVKVALTMVDYADKSGDAQAFERSHLRGRATYKEIRKLLRKLHPTEQQQVTLDQCLVALKAKLKAAPRPSSALSSGVPAIVDK